MLRTDLLILVLVVNVQFLERLFGDLEGRERVQCSVSTISGFVQA